MAYPELQYSITETAKDLPTYTAESTDKILAKQADGKMGYILVSDLQVTLDGDGLATDASVTSLSGSIRANTSFGKDAGVINQGTQSVAIGDGAGYNTQGSHSVAVGKSAGNATQGAGSVAVGHRAGDTSQGVLAVAVGYNAGLTSQSEYAVAVGKSAGEVSQGNQTVAVGAAAGEGTQAAYAVAVGAQAARFSQGTYSVAVGFEAGYSAQSASATAVGYAAGQTSQGASAVAVGHKAGQTSQATKTIIINATGVAVNGVSAQSSSFYVAPIRNAIGASGLLQYNSSTNEVTYNTLSNYANDAAAASGNVPVGGLYHTSGTVKIRLT